MDYLNTTGNRALDAEIDRALSRITALENASSAVTTTTPATTTQTVTLVAGVSSLTLTGTAAMQGDLIGTLTGSLTASQTANSAFTLSVPTLVAGTNITLTPGTGTITISASGGGSSIPVNVLTISPGSGGAFSWVIPSGLTEFMGTIIYEAQHDLTNATQARLFIVNFVPGVVTPTPTFAAQYSTNGGSSWSYMDGSSGPSLGYVPGPAVGSWVSLATGAKADVLLRIVASGGNGSTSFKIGSVYLQVK